MTITTAKLARAVAHAYSLPLALPLALGALLAAPAARADWRLTPTLDLRQTYSDNVGLAPEGREQGRFITEIRPGIGFKHLGPRLVANGTADYSFYHYLGGRVAETTRSTLRLRADGKASVIDDLLYADASASVSQEGISAFGPLFDNGTSDRNRAEVRTYRVSPYLVHNFGRTASTELRYVRDSVDTGRSGLGDSTSDTLSFRLNSGTNFNTLGWGFQASEQRVDEEIRNDSTIRLANLNLSYRLKRTFKLTAAIGYDDYDYEAVSGVNSGKSWSGGFEWAPSSRTSVRASVGRRYYGPSRMLMASHRSRQTVWSLNYNDTVSNTRTNFADRTVVDTASLVDSLLLSIYPDPVERRAAVAAYILQTGLPPSYVNNINYFSNRYVLQKELRGTMAYRGARSNAVVSVYRVRRDALSLSENDTPILGDAIDRRNDNVIQVGVNSTLTYRIKPQTSLNMVIDLIDNESTITGFESRSHALRLNARHRVTSKTSAVFEVRRSKGNTSLDFASPYSENAISASLSMQL